MTRIATVEVHKDEFKFSAGHFTIFSATVREDMHGHNYNVSISIDVIIKDNGLSFDYRDYKIKIHKLCEQLDRRFLLPQYSQYLKIEDKEDMWIAHYGQEKIPFLKRDVLFLPITNITIEELSYWFLQNVTEDPDALIKNGISRIKVAVYNGPGQSGSAEWKNDITTQLSNSEWVDSNQQKMIL